MDNKFLSVFYFIFQVIPIFCGFYSRETQPFKVYWNVPTQGCKKYGVKFDVSQYNIIQNEGDIFYGDKVTIVYGPGAFPHYDGSKAVYGGIPQLGNLVHHLISFVEHVKRNIPLNFSGVAILDFEKYQPSLARAPKIYKKQSYLYAKLRNPGKDEQFLKAFSERTFNDTSKTYFEILLKAGKALRPGATWGYYHYPYCENEAASDRQCHNDQMSSNSALTHLFALSGALYPSIYTFKGGFSSLSRCFQASTRITEAKRMRKKANKKDIKIFPYFWYRYHDREGFLTTEDILATLGISRTYRTDGAVIWGGTVDLNSRQKCLDLKEYMDHILGPIVKNLTSSDPLVVKCKNLDPEISLPTYSNSILDFIYY